MVGLLLTSQIPRVYVSYHGFSVFGAADPPPWYGARPALRLSLLLPRKTKINSKLYPEGVGTRCVEMHHYFSYPHKHSKSHPVCYNSSKRCLSFPYAGCVSFYLAPNKILVVFFVVFSNINKRKPNNKLL